MTEIYLEENPLRAGLRVRRTADPATIVILGVTGDLSHRKLLPALYRLHRQGMLPAGFSIVGFARRQWSDEDFRAMVHESLEQFLGEEIDSDIWEGFAEALFFSRGEFGDQEAYHRLADTLGLVDRRRTLTGNRLYYLAVPPDELPKVIDGLGQAGHASSFHQGWSRVVVEKPFGRDLESARELNDRLLEWYHEDQIYRIDHYLGKETVQNILVFRLANGIFEPVWNRRHVDHVQITVAEDMGVEDRGDYYEGAGAIRDIIQNHVLQLLCLVAMEPPATFDADAVRDEKAKVLRTLRPLDGSEVDRAVVRGQYAVGAIHGDPVAGYRYEKGVSPQSLTDTYVAMRVFLDNWRWAGVPFYLRTGKRLPKRVTEIAIEFKQPPLLVFGKEAGKELEPNVLAMHIQPDEGITLKIGSKVPGPLIHIHSVNMDFRYGTTFGVRAAEAYERLLLDALIGDSTLFIRNDGIEAAWRFVDGITRRWEERGEAARPLDYSAGSWGPEEGTQLIENEGRQWRRL